jgi:hypothetical protein
MLSCGLGHPAKSLSGGASKKGATLGSSLMATLTTYRILFLLGAVAIVVVYAAVFLTYFG